MRCQSCGAENPAHARFCLSCGAPVVQSVDQPRQQAAPAGKYLATQTQATMSKMIATPARAIFTFGLLLLLIGVIALAFGAWAIAVFLFIIGMFVFWLSVQVHNAEARAAASKAAAKAEADARYAPHVIHTTELREREIVKVKCRHCGSLNPDGARNCGSCGAPF